MQLQGNILDKATGQPIPGASITITTPNGTYTGIGTTSDSSGYFFLSNPVADYPNYITVSHVSYNTARAQLYEDFYIDYGTDILLDKKVVTLPPVIVTSGSNSKSLAWLLLIPAVIMMEKKNKRVSGVTKGQLTTIALGAGLLLGWNVIKKLLCKVGIYPGDCSGADAEAENNDSPWNPGYHIKYGDIQQGIMFQARINEFVAWSNTIYNSFGIFSDNWNAVKGVFDNLHTKCEVSFLADVFQTTGDSLLEFLKDGGGMLPWDGLSEAHLEILVNYVKSLPVK